MSAANPRICYNETIYDDILDEPMEYYGLTLLVFRPDPDDDDARMPSGYDTAAVRIVDDDGRMYICYHHLLSKELFSTQTLALHIACALICLVYYLVHCNPCTHTKYNLSHV